MDGVQKGQYLWNGCIWILWIVLVELCPTAYITKVRVSGSTKSSFISIVLHHVGSFHICDVLCYTKTYRGLQVVFISLAVLFFLLAAFELSGNVTLGLITGYEGIFTGLSAVYVGLATVMNETYKKNVLRI